METTSTRALLVEPSALGAETAVTATIPRSEIEAALSSGFPAELFLDVKRLSGEASAEERTLNVGWERADLERLLDDAHGDAITFSFAHHDLERAFDDQDVEAHGLRERALILTVAAATAAGAAGATGAAAAVDRGTGSSTTPIVQVSHDEALTASGLETPANDEASLAARGIQAGAAHDEATLVSRGIDGRPAGHDEATLVARGIEAPPAATHDEASLAARGIQPTPVDGGSGFELPTFDAATTAAVTGGLVGFALLITAAGFSARRARGPRPA